MTISRGARRALGALGAMALGIGLLPGLPGPSAQASAAAYRPADNGARIIGQRRVDASRLEITVRSPAVGRDLKATVLVPKGWRRDAGRTWPTVYMYAGGGGDDHTTWIKQTGLAKLARKWDALVVLPYAGSFGGYVDHFNYGKRGKPRWETHHTVELTQLMERNMRAGSGRAAMGISAGALGAVTYAGHKPGLFRYVAAFSGVLHIGKPGVPAILMAINARAGQDDPFKIWGVPGVHQANWKAHDPYELAPRLRGTGLYVSSGTTGERGPLDPKNLPEEEAIRLRILGGLSEQVTGDASKSFTARLRQLKIPVTTHFYGDGWHAWPYWNREMHRAWPAAMKALGAKPVA